MGGGFEKEYKPNPERVAIYNQLFEKYKKLGSLIEKQFN
jgi:L-ribulokinase